MAEKVLVGEDNLVTQQVLKAMLENRQCQVTTASTYDELMNYLDHDSFSLLLLDYHLDMDADVVVKKIRSRENKNKSIPIYILSAERKHDVMPRLSSFAISGFLNKPITADQLDMVIFENKISNETKPISNNDFLKSIIGDNPDRIHAISQFFLTEVPPALDKIAECLKSKDFVMAKALVHRIRPAYTYVGRDDIQLKLGDWEAELLANKNKSSYMAVYEEVVVKTQQLINTFPVKTVSPKKDVKSYDKNSDLLSGAKIMMIDNNEIILSAFSSFFKGHKANVTTATNGEAGIESIRSHKPNLILMNLKLPVLSGLDTIKQIRTNKIMTPIISYSNTTDQQQQAADVGANVFLLKPIDSNDLLKELIAQLK